MAEIVLGIGTSHTPMFAIPPEQWADYSKGDARIQELAFPPEGFVLPFDDAVAHHVPEDIKNKPRDLETFRKQASACADSIETLAAAIKAAKPDIAVIVSDDQDEWFYDDKMPSLAVYWGTSARVIPRPIADDASEIQRLIRDGYGDQEVEVKVPDGLGRHVIDYAMDHDFDVAQLTYVNETYGGSVARRYPTADGETSMARSTPARVQGLPHGFSFVVKRLFHNSPVPILPVMQNTCYPPNNVRPRRAYAFGRTLGDAIRSWDSDARVVVIASGGLSHFIVDEETDRTVLDALKRKDAEVLQTLPRNRLYSATSETLNWVAVAGAMESSPLNFDLVNYVPVYRTEAGSGGGWAFGQWV